MVVDIPVGGTVVEGGAAVVVGGCAELHAATKKRIASQDLLRTIESTPTPLTQAG